MVPCSFPESNGVLDPPEGVTLDDCGVLSVCFTHFDDEKRTPVTIACWKLTAGELETLKKTGRIWVGGRGHTMQPLFLTADNPFQEDGQCQQPTASS